MAINVNVKYCKVCGRELRKVIQQFECPNGCSQYTAQAPDFHTSQSMGAELIADGGYITKRKAAE